MGLFDSIRKKFGAQTATGDALARQWTDVGIFIKFAIPLHEASVDALLAAADKSGAAETFLAAYLSQLVVEGRCALGTAGVNISWRVVYELISSREHFGMVQSLDLPALRDLKPILASQDSMTDSTFEVQLDGWAENGAEVDVSSVQGAVVAVDGVEGLLPLSTWQTLDAVRRFNARPASERSQHENEMAWGTMRAYADAASALYRGPYLEKTYVLTPHSLRMPLLKEETPFGRVLTVEPTFEGAPAGWMKAFDGFDSVQQHYDVAPRDGSFVRVVISEPVRKVLEVVKREMPGRRVSGSRAERFVHNPWAFLGEAAHEVLNEEDFARDKAGAGALAAIFSVTPRLQDSRIERVDMVVTEHFHGGSASTQTAPFKDAKELDAFLDSLERALTDDRLQVPWNEYDLTLDGDSSTQLEHGREVSHLWRNQPSEKISFEDVYELESYSGRIEGIGVAKPIYVPLLKKPTDEDEGKPSWVPTDLTPMVKVTLAGHEGQVVIPLSKDWVEEFEKQVHDAEQAGTSEVSNSSLPTSVETGQARTLVNSFRTMLGAEQKVKADGPGRPNAERPKKETLLVKLNFFGADYVEERNQSLALPAHAEAVLPRTLRPGISLKKHQLKGVAWFQHLVSCAPADCRGALLADDMGLGKTLQLLTVLAWYYEKNPDGNPSIILAPKSLLENWEAETARFFNDSFPEVLVLYGEKLRASKQPIGLIDEQLQARGVVDLLKPDWLKNAKVVITTYEMLTSYEFSLARQSFAFVICDEAQRIKTPGTQATLAAKALKADFRIACTGTPVENTLADLWCLFDFVQPGLLGGLEEFGRTYRRPIECDSDDQKATLKALQDAISPQTLRRTKLDIKDELKDKYFGYCAVGADVVSFKQALGPDDRLEVPMSSHQNLLYLGGLKKLQDASKETDGRKRARLSFGALHLMKAVCAEPYCLPGMKFLPDKAGQAVHMTNSPKLAWMVRQLERIRDSGEKAIIFTELREVQAALYYFMREVFGIKPHIINGDSEHRQSYIDRFSAVKGFNVIILSTLAAGAGLNVIAANHVFHFTRAWNPAKENQATDRAYRLNQPRDVFVYCPVIVASDFVSFDHRLDELLKRKSGLADATIGGSGMESMLNGSGRDISFGDLVKDDGKGVALEKRYLTMDDVDRMDGFRFEVLCKLMWSKAGYLSQLTTKRGGDGGIDVIAFKGRDGELLQCKSSANREVGWDAVKEVTTGAARYQAQFMGTRFRRLAVTNQRFTAGAREHAERNKVQLVERSGLEEMLARHPIYHHDFEDEVGDSVPFLDAA